MRCISYNLITCFSLRAYCCFVDACYMFEYPCVATLLSIDNRCSSSRKSSGVAVLLRVGTDAPARAQVPPIVDPPGAGSHKLCLEGTLVPWMISRTTDFASRNFEGSRLPEKTLPSYMHLDPWDARERGISSRAKASKYRSSRSGTHNSFLSRREVSGTAPFLLLSYILVISCSRLKHVLELYDYRM